MTHEEFNRQIDEYRNRQTTLEEQLANLKSERRAFIDGYVSASFKDSGYAVGQKVTDENGRIWYVSGAHHVNLGFVYLTFNFAKKDGTMSKVRAIGRGEPNVKIK